LDLLQNWGIQEILFCFVVGSSFLLGYLRCVHVFRDVLEGVEGVGSRDLLVYHRYCFFCNMASPPLYVGKAIFFFTGFRIITFGCCIQRAIPEQMAMLMAFSASERYMFIINSLRPFLIMVFQSNGAWERLSYVEVDANARIGVPSFLGCL